MKNYDPGKIVVTFAGFLITGYAEGTFVMAERAEDGFELSVGSGGDVTRVRNRNRSGTVTLTLQAESLSNDTLSSQAALDDLFGTGFGAVMVKDLNGNTLVRAESAWIRKIANVEYGDTGATREWAIDCAELEIFAGGSVI